MTPIVWAGLSSTALHLLKVGGVLVFCTIPVGPPLLIHKPEFGQQMCLICLYPAAHAATFWEVLHGHVAHGGHWEQQACV